MKTGRRIANPASKNLAGTFRADRHADIVPMVQLVADTPIVPEWLSPGAKDVWATDLPRVVATGAVSIDSAMFALYADTMATFIGAIKAGDTPTAAYRSELRKQMELLGIAGAKSRLTKVASPDAQKASPFTVRR